MRFLRRHAIWICLFVLGAGLVGAPGPQSARTRVADGFDLPVGKPDAEGYYRSRGFRANYHMGEDWNGMAGGNKDLGAPVYATAHGLVVLARDMRMGWGNLVIIRHAFVEGGQMRTVDSVYAHLDRVMVRENQQVTRGQQVGTIGTAHGKYVAHLHFEIRKNLAIGFNQRAFPKDLQSYYVPNAFIAQHRKLPGTGRSAMVPVNTFIVGGGAPANGGRSPGRSLIVPPSRPDEASPSPSKPAREPFRVNRFDDLF